MTDDRKGDWIQTSTGVKFHPIDPRPEDVDIRDIAHALSMQCRWGGHAAFFYSVAEHCVLLSYAVPPAFALEALMHDAAEAYLVDVPRPIKAHLANYTVLEAAIEEVVAAKFTLEYPWAPIVKEYDSRILNDERAVLMPNGDHLPWGTDSGKDYGDPLNVTIRALQPANAEAEFLARFRVLNQRRQTQQVPRQAPKITERAAVDDGEPIPKFLSERQQ